MQKLKKPVSILLVFMMIVSLFAAVPMTVNAAPPGGGGGGTVIPSKTITLYANNGTDQSYSQSNTVGILNVTNPLAYDFTTPDNKTFSSWNTQPDGTGADYGSSFTYNFSSDLTLYAQWVTLYTVTWNNWDDTELETDEVEEGTTPSYDGETPTKDGVTFAGWTDSHGVFYAKDAVLPEVTADETYTAVFELTIGSVDEWNSFAASVKGGNTYSGIIVRMTADVGPVTTMVDGTFSGTFDGDGHTLTVNISGGSTTAATFAYVKDATIQNLRLEGTVTSSGIHTAALVKSVSDTGSTCTIKNVDIYADVNCSQGYIGGFIGHVGVANTVNIENSIFAGSINKTGSTQGFIGGFIGWSQKLTATINNCAFTGSYNNINSFNNIGFSYNAPTKVTVSGFYSNASEVFVANVNHGTRLYVPSSSYPTTVALVKNNDGETFYSAFSDALAAWTDGSTLALLADVTCDSMISVPANTLKILDLNGKTLTTVATNTVYGTLTIQSTVSGGNIIHTHKSQVISVQEEATLNINSGTIHGYNADRAVIGGAEGGTYNLNGGKIVTSASNAFSIGSGSTLNLNGGEIECTSGSTSMGTASAVWAHGDSTINWNGTAITTNTGDGIRMKSAGNGTVNVTGGSFTATSSSLPEEGGYAVYVNSNMSSLNLKGNLSFSGRGIYLTNDKVINITDELSNTNPISVTMQTPGVFTSGLAENGDATNFANGNGTGYALTLNASGEAQIVSTYTITWNNWDDTELEKDTGVAEGVTPEYNGATPQKPDNATNYYTFSGWTDGTNTYALTDTLPEVTGDVTYTAVFESAAKFEAGYYIFGSMNGWSREEAYRLTPNPSNQNEYMFIGIDFNANDEFKVVRCAPGQDSVWFPDYAGNCEINDGGRYSVYFNPSYGGGDDWYYGCIYVAPVTYTVTWKLDEDTVIDSAQVAHGTVPTHDDPTKDADAQYTYTFAGWDVEPVAVTEDATYTATFTPTLREYTVTWKLDEDTVIDSAQVAYGTVPTHEDAFKLMDGEYVYTFIGWDHEIEAVTGDVTYTATFNRALMYIDENGYYYEDGVLVDHKGLVLYHGDYYYVTYYGQIRREGIRTVEPWLTNRLLPTGLYYFGADGKMTTVLEGIDENGYYRENGVVIKNKGLIEIDGDYYYVIYNGKVKMNGDRTVTAEMTNGLLPVGTYHFGADGKMTTVLNGIGDDGYYRENGEIIKDKGLVEIDGDYYYVIYNGKVKMNGDRTVSADKTNGLLPAGIYTFGADGKMTTVLNGVGNDGFYRENGEVIKDKGLIEIDGDYYFVIYNGTVKMNGLRTVTALKSNGLLPAGDYFFGADGKMVLDN